MNDYQESLKKHITQLPQSTLPAPWRKVCTVSVGGLTDVGYGEGSDLLLAVSHSGRGVIDCTTGTRVARDPDDKMNEWHDQVRLIAQGIGPLEGNSIPMAGLWGGGLPLTTRDAWSLYVFNTTMFDVVIALEPPGCSVLTPDRSTGCVLLDYDNTTEFRACGFSPTGMTFVAACSSDIDVYCRK